MSITNTSAFTLSLATFLYYEEQASTCSCPYTCITGSCPGETTIKYLEAGPHNEKPKVIKPTKMTILKAKMQKAFSLRKVCQ